ncbi:MAG: hypothetical protein JW818_19860 [Pirellulales bacterium]|nr:hypothetical protein [Pirellulales bacterium]
MTAPSAEVDALHENPTVSPSVRAVSVAGLGLAAAWVAAGSTGFLAGPFRGALAGGLLLGAIVLGLRRDDVPVRPFVWLFALVVVGALAANVWLPVGPIGGVLGVAGVLGMLAWRESGVNRRAVLLIAWAAGALALYRLACWTSPTVWAASAWLSQAMGRLVSIFTSRPLDIGPSFGGLDFLVPMVVLYVGWLWWTERPQWTRALFALVGIVIAQGVYLVVLARANDLAALLPDAPVLPLDPDDYRPPDWTPAFLARAALPWNVPLVAAVIQTIVAVLMLRWARWHVKESSGWTPPAPRPRGGLFAGVATACVAMALAATMTFSWIEPDLAGKTIVIHNHASLNWTQPTPGDYRPGVAEGFGMLPSFVSSLGGRTRVSTDLTEADLDGADVLVLLDPSQPWTADVLGRIEAFVRDGGSLLVAAGPVTEETKSRGPVDDVLEPAGMAIRFDMAQPAAPGWQDALTATTCPAALGLNDRTIRLGLRLGSSIDARWPVRPILIGTWGYADSASDALTTIAPRFEPGERLGDLVLAAWRPLGRGKVAAVADSYCLSNIGTLHAWPFTGRLLAFLAHPSSDPQDVSRQVLALVFALVLAWLVVWQNRPPRVAVAALALLVGLGTATWISRTVGRVVPLGESDATRPIAYIDGSHHEAYSTDPWSNRGLDGLMMSLARAGYFPLVLPELDEDQLDQAAVFISIGPSESFPKSERAMVARFVDEGGLFVATIGATESAANEALLDDFKFQVLPSPIGPGATTYDPEPVGDYNAEALGHIRMPYLSVADPDRGDYSLYVWLFAGWPVQCTTDDAQILIPGSSEWPVAVGRDLPDKGAVVVIGDTCFGLNHNMGYHNGQAIAQEGLVGNDQFWRWMLGRMTGREKWIPPNPAPPRAPADVEPSTGLELPKLNEPVAPSDEPPGGEDGR